MQVGDHKSINSFKGNSVQWNNLSRGKILSRKIPRPTPEAINTDQSLMSLKFPAPEYLVALLVFSVTPYLVKSPNSPFFPPHIGAEPGQAKEESRITCMRMLRTSPFLSPQIGGKTIFGSIFQIWLVARFSE